MKDSDVFILTRNIKRLLDFVNELLTELIINLFEEVSLLLESIEWNLLEVG